MTQPSTLDLGLPESSLLFTAGSSSFVCIADTIEVIIDSFIQLHRTHNIRQAAKLVHFRRARCRLSREPEESGGEKHPKTFFILFVVTLLQAIKLFGCQGIRWTQVLAGIYLGSYVVLAIIWFLVPENERMIHLLSYLKKKSRQEQDCCDKYYLTMPFFFMFMFAFFAVI
jgi:hypothetical protein